MKKNGTRRLRTRSKRRFVCGDCELSWCLGERQVVNENIQAVIVRESLERGSIRILARRFQKSKQWIMDTIHQGVRNLASSEWIAKRFQPTWSGILVVDGKFVKVWDRLESVMRPSDFFSETMRRAMHMKVWLCGIDSGTGDLPHYDLADEETKVDLVLYFKKLKEIGYVLNVLVCDGNEDIVSAARKVFGSAFLVQRCTRHFVEGQKRKAIEASCKDHLLVLECITLIQKIIEASSLAESCHYIEDLKRRNFRHPVCRLLIADFKQHSTVLTTHLFHPELHIPHTSNEIENLFKQLGLRLTSFGRFGHWIYARDYLNAWALLRRCTPFTDCRGERRCRNGKSPLQLAGCHIGTFDPVKPPN